MPVQFRPGVPFFYAPHAEAVEATACKPVLTRCESGAALHFSPRDVTDSMRGFEPRRQGATPCVETKYLPRVAQQERHPVQNRTSARANRAAGTNFRSGNFPGQTAIMARGGSDAADGPARISGCSVVANAPALGAGDRGCKSRQPDHFPGDSVASSHSGL